MGPSGLLYGPTGSKIGGGGGADKEPTGGDFKTWCDWHAANKLFGAGFFSSQVADPMSWGQDHVSNGGQGPSYEDDPAEGSAHMLFDILAGTGSPGKAIIPSRVGNAGARFGFWPNSFLMVGFVAKFTFNAVDIATNPPFQYEPYDGIRETRHGFSSQYLEGFFVGMHGGLIRSYAFDGASNPFVLTCGSGWNGSAWAFPNGAGGTTRGNFMTSTVPLVTNKWYRILVARDGINTYFKVNAEPWQSRANIYEDYPLTDQFRTPMFMSSGGSSGPQVASQMRLGPIYTARGVQRINP